MTAVSHNVTTTGSNVGLTLAIVLDDDDDDDDDEIGRQGLQSIRTKLVCTGGMHIHGSK